MENWKEALAGRIEPQLEQEIDNYATQLELKRQGKIDDKVFAETRLRRGAYGQRYDNGQRHDGIANRELDFPSTGVTKGPDTHWDAPGMMRIKIPFGGLTPAQLEVLGDLAEEYSDAVCHVTTRQDIQLHFVRIDDTPDLMRRLAAVGVTTREACGNTVRNLTACPVAGVCGDEVFDVTPYARALSRFLLGHRDAQEFGRKFKVAFSGCADKACGLVNMHDLGFIGRVREVEGVQRRGFETFVGGGLGTIPYPAQLFDDFVPEEEILPLAQAICRVFARLGEKRNRARARLKFLVAKLGIEEFRRLVLEERAGLLHDAAWTDWLEERKDWNEVALKAPSVLGTGVKPSGFDRWYRSNVAPQKQAGYAVVTVALPLGDLSSWQIRRLAAIARRYVGDKLRTTVEQNIVLRWVSEADLPELYAELCEAGLGAPGAGTMTDITACPGTDTCKLGIASSRGLARELSTRLASRSVELDAAIEGLHVKISGCFNSCGQHHIADLGFYGVSRKVGGTTVPHFQVVLGGQWEANAGAYGLAMGAVPSRRVPEVVERLTDHYVKQRQDGETFRGFVARIGKKAIRGFLQDLMVVPAYEEDSSFYSDWGDPREFTLSDLGVGECAGEVVAQADFDLAAAEGDVFDAQISLDEGDYDRAGDIAYRSMLEAARGLIRVQFPDVGEDPDGIVGEFKKRFCDTELFYDKYAGAKFAHYLLRRHAEGTSKVDEDYARRLVEEAQLFIEAAHACYLRMLETPAGVVSPPV